MFSNAVFIVTPAGYNTPTGENVQVNDPDIGVTLVFDSITAAGNTEVTVSVEPSAPDSGFAFLDNYYDVVANAAHSGNIAIAVSYDDTGMAIEQEQGLSLLHRTGTIWEDVTVSRDTTNNTVTGVVSSLSWPAVGTPPRVTWLPPLSTGDVNVAQEGRTLPVKFQLTGATGGAVSDLKAIVTTAQNSDGATVFSEPAGVAGNHYQVNVKTKDWAAGDYTIRVSVNKGATCGLRVVD